MTLVAQALAKAKDDPRGLASAVVRRIVPWSPKFGAPWIHLDDGSVTFHERGFVSADSPSALLARHNYEGQRIRRELRDFPRFSRSLEVGCGFGRLSMIFAEHSDEHVAVDINPVALELARATYPQIRFEETKPTRLEFPDDHFDLVATWTVVQHIRPEKVGELCADIKRVLAPGGVLLLCEETREPEKQSPRGHTWHRIVEDYETLFDPLVLEEYGYIDELDAIAGLVSPGRVMRFRAP